MSKGIERFFQRFPDAETPPKRAPLELMCAGYWTLEIIDKSNSKRIFAPQKKLKPHMGACMGRKTASMQD
jgi:hypothetical protein